MNFTLCIMKSYLEVGYVGRYTIILYQMHLKEYSIGSHVCTNVV